MKREVFELDYTALETLRAIRDELIGLRTDLRPQASTPSDEALLQAILTYVGTLARFSAAELIETADVVLLAALGDRDAARLGRDLAEAEGVEVFGRRLVRRGKGSAGISWAFE